MRHRSIVISLLGLSLAVSASAGELEEARRIDAHRAVEQVLWERRTWPEANLEPKPPLQAVLPESALRARVEEVLRKSAALAALWHRPIGNHELQAEMDRMFRDSRAPDTLDAMVEALDRDPLLVAEVIARPALVDRLIRSWYASDARFHAAERREADRAFVSAATAEELARIAPRYRTTTWTLEEAAGPSPGTVVLDPSEWQDLLDELGDQPLGQIGPLKETEGEYSATVVLSRTERSVRVGVASWPKTAFDTWWSAERGSHAPALPDPGPEEPLLVLPERAASPSTPSCADDTWTRTGTGAPVHGLGHATVWTGSEMIVWAGVQGSSVPVNSGGRYDPATDTWTTLSTIGAPEPRGGPVAVWTGSKVVVYGGGTAFGDLNTGGRYDPLTDAWTPMSVTGTPTARALGAVWTGARMLVWSALSGIGGPIEGRRYDPVADTWSAMTLTGAPIQGLELGKGVWAGSVLVLWPGKRYDPVADVWTPISSLSAPSPRTGHTLVWTGSKVIAWGGSTGSSNVNDGGVYDPSTDTWSPMSTAGVPQARSGHTAIWVAGRMVVWGGHEGDLLNTGGRYDPVTNTWAGTSVIDAPFARNNHTAVATPTRMIVWGGTGVAVTFASGGIYDPVSNTWVPTRVGTPSPPARSRHTAVWTGAEMILWGGQDDTETNLGNGVAYSPATDSWLPLSPFSEPSARVGHKAVWTGTTMLVWGGYDGTPYTDTGGRYSPASDSWAPMTTAGAPTGRIQHAAVWTGSRMIVWGGTNDPKVFNLFDTGGRYDPVNDTWAPVATLGAPLARVGATAVWTGSKMVVWGGAGSGSYQSTGGRYDPGTDSWSATTTSNVPAGRYGHAALWTGSRMLVWGGYDSSGPLGTGGSYNASSDSWSPLSTSGAPMGRVDGTAIWTGTEMIVWGGVDNFGYVNTGGRYLPENDSWRPTSLSAAPRSRVYHSGVWTGSGMVIWGGFTVVSPAAGNYNDGASYCSCVSWYPDADGDGFGPTTGAVSVCDGTHPAGRVVPTGDCDDGNPAIHPGLSDASCNGVNEDCDAETDEDYLVQPSVCGSGVCRSFGSLDCVSGEIVNSCVPGTPSAPVDDTCNTLDDDCDGSVDEEFPLYPDHWIPIASAPVARTNYTAVSSGNEFLVFGGDNGSGVVQTGGVAYDFLADTWRSLPVGPAKRWHHTAVWADTRMIVWGGDDGATTIYNSGSRYDPGTNTWAATTTTGAPTARGGHSAVWTGSRMVIWGGRDVSNHFNTGSRYDPTANSWSATTTTGAPSARWLHTAVWTGTEMIVWGGQAATSAALNTGARYDPSSNTWTAVSTTGAPSPRFGHVAVWTGTEMVVWGGTSGATTYLATGARYNPSTNTWTAMSMVDAPSPRAFTSAAFIWPDVVIWGGTYRTNEDPDTALSDGARYLLGNNVWVPVNTFSTPPSARARTMAVLQAGEMIVWGGDPNGAARSDGARYAPFTICGVGSCLRLASTVCSGGTVSFQCTPGTPQPELCDGRDNNCNGTIDDVPVPTGVPMMVGTRLVDDTALFNWGATPNTSYYDMVRGSLATLRGTGGDFTNSLCMQNDNPMTQGWDVAVPPPGDGTWYLVRPVNACSGNGSWNDTMPPQQGSRDAELAASAGACP